MRLGEEDAATGEFSLAANALVRRHDWLGAGQLILDKLGRTKGNKDFLDGMAIG